MTDSAEEWGSDYQKLPPLAQAVVLAIAKLRLAHALGDSAVTTLTDNATEMMTLASELPESPESEKLTTLSFDAVTTTQYFDRQTQQIDHIVSLLARIYQSAMAAEGLTPAALDEMVQASYDEATMSEERGLIDAFRENSDLISTISDLQASFNEEEEDDDALF